MVAVFVYSWSTRIPRDGVYLFDSERDAELWCVAALREAGLVVEVDGGWRLTDDSPDAPISKTAGAILDKAQDRFDSETWLHVQRVFDMRDESEEKT